MKIFTHKKFLIKDPGCQGAGMQVQRKVGALQTVNKSKSSGRNRSQGRARVGRSTNRIFRGQTRKRSWETNVNKSLSMRSQSGNQQAWYDQVRRHKMILHKVCL